MAIHVVVVHGVGPFNQASTEKRIKSLLSSPESGLFSVASISSLDWSRVVGTPFAKLTALASGFLELPFVDSFQGESSDLHGSSVADLLLLIAQMVSLALVPVLVTSFVVSSPTPFLAYLCTNIALLLAVIFAEWLLTGSLQLGHIIRRFAFVWAWPILHLAIAPIYLAQLIWALVPKFANVFATILFHVLVITLFGGVLVVLLSLPLAILVFVVGMAIISACAAFIYIVPRLLAYLPVKVVCDVVLWLHDSSYRASLRTALSAKITALRLRDSDLLVLVTHSLDSIIALDYMVSPESLPRKYLLITMGSPLRSLLCKFFPELFSSPVSLCEFLSARNPSFEWINVFRPFDPIGCELGITETSDGAEMSTAQKTRFHMNYWGDQSVFRCVETCIESLRHRVRMQDASNTVSSPVWVPLRRPIRFRPAASFWRKGPKLVRISVLIVGFLSASLGARFAAKELWLDNERLAAEGKASDGVADCFLKAPDSGTSLPSDHYVGNCEITFNGVKYGSRSVQLTKHFNEPMALPKSSAFGCNRQ